MPIFVYFSERWCKQRALAGLGNLYNFFLYLRVFFLKKFVFKKMIQARTSKDLAFFFCKVVSYQGFFFHKCFSARWFRNGPQRTWHVCFICCFCIFFYFIYIFSGRWSSHGPQRPWHAVYQTSLFFCPEVPHQKKKFFSKTSLIFLLFFFVQRCVYMRVCEWYVSVYVYLFVRVYVYVCIRTDIH